MPDSLNWKPSSEKLPAGSATDGMLQPVSVIITSNKSFGEWGSLFGDPVLATAILDRLLHHATVINIKGNSYRLKDRARQGIWANPGVADQIHSGEVSNQGNSALS
jgi:hypothetical protein